MINNKTIKKLEYQNVLQFVADFAVSNNAKSKVLETLPSDDIDNIRYLLNMTNEALQFINYGIVPDFMFDDVTNIAEKARIVSTLSMRELLCVMRLLKISRNLKDTVMSFGNADVPILRELASKIYSDKNLEEDIDFCIISDEEMNDNASDTLCDIRKKIKRTNSEIRDKLNSYTKSKDMSMYLQDAIVTMRNDRYVIPVKQEYKNNVNGLVHDQSASGSTVFIEPLAIVNLNNELKTLLLQENEEIEHILSDFTKQVSKVYSFLLNNQNTICDIDVSFAKARYAIDTHSTMPSINVEGKVSLINARHPLISRDKVVPVTVNVGLDFNIVIITGPNTGGKTVTLKTIGLFCLLTYSGIFIPATESSYVALYDDIFCDIGDEQSIEQSLSTFSSHINNIAQITKKVNSNTLVLIDELGAGTEPNEGAAIALAITEFLLHSGARAVMTTHYGQLKEYALVTDGIENASMEFNPTTFAPTYKLVLGVPGSSNAIEIASNLGLGADIIASARGKLSAEKITFEKVLQNAEKIRQEYQEEKIQIEKEHIELSSELDKAKQQNKLLLEEREKLLKNSRVEARQIVAEAQEDSKELLDKLKQIVNRAELDESILFEARGVAKKISNRKYETSEDDKDDNQMFIGEKINPANLNVGDKIFVKSLSCSGFVTRFEKGNRVNVKCGNLSTVVKINDLYQCVEIEKKKPTKKTSKVQIRTEVVPSEINLLGQTVDEGVESVGKFIDNAILAGLHEVRVIHGNGTGKLRQGLHNYFRNHHGIKEFRLGVYGEGESGVTIVTLK